MFSLGFRIYGLARVQDLGSRVYGLRFRILGVGCICGFILESSG